MHSIIKSSFYLIFMVSMLIMGIHMLIANKNNKFYTKFGIMTLILGLGESFHLIPRVLNIFSSDLFSTELLETGQLISSITIIIVYILLYTLWKDRYNITETKLLNATMYGLGLLSIVMSLTLRNPSIPLLILRNIPLLLVGIIIIMIYSRESKKVSDPYFKLLHLTVLLSLIFYLPVELLENTFEVVVILMLPKTIMYIWMIGIGYRSFIKETV